MHCSFIPDYLLQNIIDTAARDDDHPGICCRHTLQLDDQVRTRRRTAEPAASEDEDAKRAIYDAHHTEELPGRKARAGDQDDPTGDSAVDEAFDSSGVTWDTFTEVFDRSSYDGNGSVVVSTVHYGQDYDNAFWDGKQLVFGDGDGEIFNRFTKPMDVLAHEFTHGVTQYTAKLDYSGQSGALNESISDVFAAITKQRSQGQDAASADWLIGVGIFAEGVQAKALRSMKEPGTAYDDPRLGSDPQVGSMSDYVDTSDDNGGVHTNSGIPNRAFYLAATALGGNSWDQAGPIWYQALTGGDVHSDTDFSGFARACINAAQLLDANRNENRDDNDDGITERVRQAWTTVGVLDDTRSAAAPGDQQSAPAGPVLTVRRTGGIAGVPRGAEVDLDRDPNGPKLRQLLDRIDFTALGGPAAPQPDRFVYRIRYGTADITVDESGLPADLAEAIRLIFHRPGPTD